MTNCEAQNKTQCHTETMKILHTSDWHLGRTFHRSPLTREHQQFIDELLNYVNAEGIDTLLISGDVYDSTIPTAESTTLLANSAETSGARVNSTEEKLIGRLSHGWLGCVGDVSGGFVLRMCGGGCTGRLRAHARGGVPPLQRLGALRGRSPRSA